MSSKKIYRKDFSTRNRLQVECLETRKVLALYIPDLPVYTGETPVAASFNGGEQLLFRGTGGELRFGFGQSDTASQNPGVYWNDVDVDSLLSAQVPHAVGIPDFWETSPLEGQLELHATWRSAAGELVDINADTWEATQLPVTGVASDPVGAAMNGGRQIAYVGTDRHLHLVASTDQGANWISADLDLIAHGNSTFASASGGVTVFALGQTEYYVTRSDGGNLNVISLTNGVWSYQSLNAFTLAGYERPTNGPDGSLTSVSYAQAGGSVAWVFYHGADDTVRGAWLVQGQSWQTAQLSPAHVSGAVSSAYDEVAGTFGVGYFDNSGSVHLLSQGSPAWSNRDYQSLLPVTTIHTPAVPASQATGTVSLSGGSFSVTVSAGGSAEGVIGNSTNIVIQNAPGIAQATGVLTLNTTAASISISAQASSLADGAAGNNINVVLQAGVLTGVASFTGGTLTVNVASGDTVANIAAAIDSDARFNATPAVGGSSTTVAGDLTTYANVTSGGASGSTSASYNASSNVITVAASANATISNLAAAINALADFNAVATSGGSAFYDHFDNGTFSNPLSGGADASGYIASRPTLYLRHYVVGAFLPGLQVVYKDNTGVVQIARLTGQGAL